jgi:hypothetical protein
MCDLPKIFGIQTPFTSRNPSQITDIVKFTVSNQKIDTQLIVDYVTFMIPTFIPIIGILLIPVLMFVLVNRYKIEISLKRHVFLFLGLNLLLTVLIALLFIFSYDFIISIKSSICNFQDSSIPLFDALTSVINDINSLGCDDIKIDLDLYSVQTQLYDAMSTVNNNVHYLYSLALVVFQLLVLPLVLFTSIIFFKLKNKCFFYFLFCTLLLFSWFFGCIAFSTSLVGYDLNGLKTNIIEDPNTYLGTKNCDVTVGSIQVFPCHMVQKCDKNPDSNFIDHLFNFTENATLTNNLAEVSIDILKEELPSINVEQAEVLFDILLNEDYIEIFESLNELGAVLDTNNVDSLLNTILADVGLFTNETNASIVFIQNIQNDLAQFDDTLTSEEFISIVNNASNIPDEFDGMVLSDAFPLFDFRRRRLSEEDIFNIPLGDDLSSITCPAKIMKKIFKENYKCSLITNTINTLEIAEISNALFLYSIISFLFVLSCYLLLPFFTSPGTGGRVLFKSSIPV